MQVENEYGSFAKEEEYMLFIRTVSPSDFQNTFDCSLFSVNFFIVSVFSPEESMNF